MMIQSKPVETIQNHWLWQLWVMVRKLCTTAAVHTVWYAISSAWWQKRGVYKQLPENARTKSFCHSIKNGSNRRKLFPVIYTISNTTLYSIINIIDFNYTVSVFCFQ